MVILRILYNITQEAQKVCSAMIRKVWRTMNSYLNLLCNLSNVPNQNSLPLLDIHLISYNFLCIFILSLWPNYLILNNSILKYLWKYEILWTRFIFLLQYEMLSFSREKQRHSQNIFQTIRVLVRFVNNFCNKLLISWHINNVKS